MYCICASEQTNDDDDDDDDDDEDALYQMLSPLPSRDWWIGLYSNQ